MADEILTRTRYGEAFWRAHHEVWRRSELNQREYCEAQGTESAHPPRRCFAILHLLGMFVVSWFRSRRRLELFIDHGDGEESRVHRRHDG